MQTLAQMEVDYIDAGTRAVTVEFNIYNVNYDVFLVGQVGFYFDTSGHVEKYERFSSIKLMRNSFFCNSVNDKVVMYSFFVMTAFFVLIELLELSRSVSLYIQDSWNVFEALHLFIIVLSVVQNYVYKKMSDELVDQLLADGGPNLAINHFVEMAPVRSQFRNVKLWMAGNAFCGVIKTFKYMRLSKQLSSLWDILVRASGAMANFGKFASALLRRRCAILHSPHLQNYRCNRSGDQSVHHVRVRAGRDHSVR